MSAVWGFSDGGFLKGNYVGFRGLVVMKRGGGRVWMGASL